MKFGKLLLCFLLGISFLFSGRGQTPRPDIFRFAFYNCENYFHPHRDSGKNDVEYMPEGKRHWTFSKYKHKKNQIFKVITALDDSISLLGVGLAEVENQQCLRDLCYSTPLRFKDYRFVHYESHDPRGIDVAFIYNAQRLSVLDSKAIPVIYENKTTSSTRDILYVQALTKDYPQDTFHLFVCHFPSKYGGVKVSEPKRASAAKVLHEAMGKIPDHPRHHCIAMGDFNAEPDETALIENFPYGFPEHHSSQNRFINLMGNHPSSIGSHKYRSQWSKIDHFICNLQFFTHHLLGKFATIFSPDFLLMPDENYFGEKPFRTFYGAKYLGGFSDHLPVYINFSIAD